MRLTKDLDFALQAVQRGFVAVCVEQTGFGLCRERHLTHTWNHPCLDAVTQALLLGRTLLGERVADVIATVDWLQRGQTDCRLDTGRVMAMGNSAGGETAVYAAVFEPRVRAVIASGCVGGFRATRGVRKGCLDVIIPGILEWMEFEDVLALCAPRPLLVVSGENDHLFPFAQARATTELAREVYAAMGSGAAIGAVAGPDGHRFYAERAWPVFLDMLAASGVDSTSDKEMSS